MYAIIEDSGTQIKVSEGDVIRIDRRDLPGDADQAPTVTFDRVMLVSGDDSAPRIGEPYVDGAKVTADVVDENDSEKYEIVKFRRRKNYRLRKGHRQHFLKVKITGIEG